MVVDLHRSCLLVLLSAFPSCTQLGQTLRTRMDALSSLEASLKSHREQLERSKTSNVRRRRGIGVKEGIYGGIEEAVFELRAAVSKVLNVAMSRVEVAHVASLEKIKGVGSGITELLTEVGKTCDVRDSLKGVEVSKDDRCSEHYKLSLLSMPIVHYLNFRCSSSPPSFSSSFST